MFFCALKLTSVVDVTVIGAVQPALVLIVTRPLFGERMGRWDVFWILVAMAGVSAAVIGPGVTSHHQLFGDLLATGSMLSWSAYWLVSKHARAKQNALEYTAVVTIVAAGTLTLVVLVSGQSLAGARRRLVVDSPTRRRAGRGPSGDELGSQVRRRLGLVSYRIEQPDRRGRSRGGHPPPAPDRCSGLLWPYRTLCHRDCRRPASPASRIRAGMTPGPNGV